MEAARHDPKKQVVCRYLHTMSTDRGDRSVPSFAVSERRMGRRRRGESVIFADFGLIPVSSSFWMKVLGSNSSTNGSRSKSNGSHSGETPPFFHEKFARRMKRFVN